MAVIVFAETGLLVATLPGDSLLVTAGLFAARGDLDIVTLNLLLMAMAVSGDATGYFLGARIGPRLFSRPKSLLFKPEHLVKTHAFYERHGGKTIIIARFMPFVRTFAPVVAGMGKMGYPRFAAYNVIGGVLWVGSMTMTGYVLIQLFPGIDQHLHYVIATVVFLSILPGIIAYARHWWARRAAPAPQGE